MRSPSNFAPSEAHMPHDTKVYVTEVAECHDGPQVVSGNDMPEVRVHRVTSPDSDSGQLDMGKQRQHRDQRFGFRQFQVVQVQSTQACEIERARPEQDNPPRRFC